MKRQQSLLGLEFAKKISRIEISEQQSIKNKMSVSNAVIHAENTGATNDLQCCDRQMLFQTAGVMNNMIISEKNMMG